MPTTILGELPWGYGGQWDLFTANSDIARSSPMQKESCTSSGSVASWVTKHSYNMHILILADKQLMPH